MGIADALARFATDRSVVLELDLARGVLVARPDNPLQALQLINSPTLQGLREHLQVAATDERVKGLIVHASPGPDIAHGEEIAALIEDFGKSRPTMAWADSFGELMGGLGAYRIAAAAHEIWVQPTGMLSIEGVSLEILLLRGAFEKAGLVPEFGQRHEYKSAANTYAADHITGPHREMMQRIGESIMAGLVSEVARRRSVDEQLVRDAIDASPLTPDRALALGLIDKIGYRDEAYAAALGQWGVDPGALVFAHRYSSRTSLARKLQHGQPKVAVISLRGAIVTGRGSRSVTGGQSAGADVVDEQLRHALRDDSVQAVVFAVDSPGGSAVASDFIRRGVIRLKEAGKPVVAHMGTVAASGGYYVSMASNEIVAQSGTLTGSIGVLGGKIVTRGLYDKLGLIREAISFSASAGTFSAAHQFSEEDWDRLNGWLDRIYLDFTTAAAQDRAMAYDDLEKLARGRVWTGADARERGLVDHIGGRRVALERACALAGLDVASVKVAHLSDPGWVSMVVPAKSSEASSSGANLPSAEATWKGLLAKVGIVAPGVLSVPFTLGIH